MALLLLALGIVLTFWSFRQIENATQVRKITFAAINDAQALLSELKDAETGQRGYLLTANEAFLEPYMATRDTIGDRLKKLRRMSLERAAQDQLDALAPLIDAKLAELSQTIDLRRKHQVAFALARVSDGQGKQWMDAIRVRIGDFNRIESETLEHNEEQFQSDMHRMFSVIVAASLVELLSALSFAWLIHRNLQQRVKAQVYFKTKNLLEAQMETNTQLQLTNASLLASEFMLREAQDLAKIGNWSWDLDTDCHVWSKEIYRIFDRDPNLPPALHPEVQACFTPDRWTRISSHAEQVTPYTFETEVVRADGSRRWMTVRGQATRDVHGIVVELHGTMQDISARHQIEIEQTRLNRSLRLLSDFNATLVRATDERDLLIELCRLVVESGGYQMGWVGIAEQNDAKSVRPVAQSGYEEGYLDSARISWDREQGTSCGLTGTAIRTGFTQITQNCLINSAAPWRDDALDRGYQASIALPLIIESQILGALTLYSSEPESFHTEEVRLLEELANNMAYGMQSLRTRRELELYHQHLEARVAQRTQEIAALNIELLEKASDAEAANCAKSAFLATMSHEIRTPLNAVVGLIGLLADSPLNRRQRDYAGKLEISAQALRGLVDDILDFSKIEAGALVLEHAPFSLNAILSTTAAQISVNMRGKPIEALFDVAPDVPDALIGDGMRLQQILLNLTGNAIKFTEQGEIVVAVRCLARQAGWLTLQFSVRDTGIGIPAEQFDQIFDMFTQADSTTTRLYGGTGLGLAISARLVGLMGSQIGVGSMPGRGSEFDFTVVLAMADTIVTVPESSLPNPALNVLIVDDHPLARDILQRTCAGFGWRAAAFGSGIAALDELRLSAAEGRDYDLMLLDWHMPSMNGIEMLRQAYGAPDIGLPQVIIMASIFELAQAVAACDDLYIDGIVTKPMTPASLFEAVTRAQAGDFTAILPPLRRIDRRLTGMRLLIVEDNAINQQVIEQILTRSGAEVVIAANGLAALDALRPPFARFDAVLMDIQMPGMDGHVASRIMREEMGWIDLPIIAVTAHAMPEDREKSRYAGMVGHIVKPINVEDLLDILAGARLRLPDTRPESGWKTTSPAMRLAGVDVAAALKSFGGNKKKYVELLRQFINDHASDADEARRLFGTGDRQGAARLVHGLRGMASLLQASDIARLTGATARALRDVHGEAVLPLFDELQVAMHALIQSIDQFDAVDYLDRV